MCALQVGAGMTWSVYAHRPGDSIASMTRKLASKTRMVFDYLLMTKNSTGHVLAA